jgi:hypothetical protein
MAELASKMRRGRGAVVLAAFALMALAVANPGDVRAQAQAAQGPRVPFLGPSSPPTEPQGPARETSAVPSGRSARCRWDLGGTWDGSGQQTEPTSRAYSSRVVIRQFGSQLVADQSAESITYYGVCSGDRIELDAYNGETLIGALVGTMSSDGRRIEATWVLNRPEYAAGYQTLTAAGRSSR